MTPCAWHAYPLGSVCAHARKLAWKGLLWYFYTHGHVGHMGMLLTSYGGPAWNFRTAKSLLSSMGVLKKYNNTTCMWLQQPYSYHALLNDQEFWLILLFRDWPRRAFLDSTSEWVHRKCLTTVYSGSLWCHNENADFRVKFLLGLASLVCIFLWRHNIRTSFRAVFDCGWQRHGRFFVIKGNFS